MVRRAAAWLIGAAALCAAIPAARGQEKEPPPAKVEDAVTRARKLGKARRLLKASRWLEQTKAGVTGSIEEREGAGWIPPGTATGFSEAADWNGLLDMAAAAWATELDEEALDAAILFYESDPGKRLATAQPKLVVGGASFVKMWTAATLAQVATSGEGGLKEKAKGLFGRFRGDAKPEDNEKAAVGFLESLQTAQRTCRDEGRIDADADGIGEFATLMELAGTAGARRGSVSASGDRAAGADFSGPPPSVKQAKPLLGKECGAVDGDGILEKDGYLFRIFLPDDRAAEAGFVHETGPSEAPGLAGDALRVGVDLSETVWMAYAWPKERGKTGTAAYFVGKEGAVLRSPNEAARWSGTDRAPKPSSALLGTTVTASPAQGTLGRDGDRWE